MQLVQSVVPVAKFHEETSRELTFILPYNSIGEKFVWHKKYFFLTL